MPHFDDPEHKKISESIAKKLEQVLKGLRDMTPEEREEVKERMRQIDELLAPVLERKKLGIATEEDEKFLKEVAERSAPLLQSLEDTQLLLNHHFTGIAVAYYNHVKEAAGKGDEKAKEIYEELRPLYRKMMQDWADDPDKMN